jgi:hypothetical protein
MNGSARQAMTRREALRAASWLCAGTLAAGCVALPSGGTPAQGQAAVPAASASVPPAGAPAPGDGTAQPTPPPVPSTAQSTAIPAAPAAQSTPLAAGLDPDHLLCPHFYGFGAQGDFFLTLPQNTGRGVKEEDIRLVLERVGAMRPHIMRTFFNYDWWEPIAGRPTPDSPHMRDYLRWVRFLKEIGCAVMLVPWGDGFAYSDWMHTPANQRLPDPQQREGMLRSLVDLVAFLQQDQGLDNVRYVCLMNEPDNDPKRPVPVDDFVALYRRLDEILRERELREAVTVVGVDGSDWGEAQPGEWFYEVVTRGLEYCDAVASHTYGAKQVPSLVPWMRSRRALLTGASAKPLMITEFNTYGGTFDNQDNGAYWHGLFLADFAITALREGAAALLMWCLMDTWYDDLHKQQYGLWRFRDAAWAPRPGFYSWSLITRYTRPGSQVFAVDADGIGPEADIDAVGLLSPEGKLSLLAINRASATRSLRLGVGLSRGAELAKYQYTEAAVSTAGPDLLPASGSVRLPAGGMLELQLPATSFTVLSEIE